MTPPYDDPLGRTLFSYEQDGLTHVEAAPGQAVCDFCQSPDVRWSYPCGPVRVYGHPFITDSDDEWATCQQCHDEIEARLPVSVIAKRMIERQFTHPVSSEYRKADKAQAIANQSRNLIGFLKARQGPPVHE